MTDIKSAAFAELNELYTRGDISYLSYSMIFDGLDDIETLYDRDAEIKELWEEFGDVPMNPETECMEEAFLGFPAGTHREEIWHWFDERYSKGVHTLLYGDIKEVDEMSNVVEKYIRLIDTADSVDKISEITNRAAWDVSITNQEYCEIYDYAVNKVRDWR